MTRPPSTGWRIGRRSSFARRDSNLALLGAMFTGIVIALALLLLLFQRINPQQGSQLRGAMADALSPLLSVVRAPLDLVRGIGGHLESQWQAARRNRQLMVELAAMRQRAQQAELLEAELKRMDRLLGMRRPERRLVAAAVASASAASGAVRTAIISAGLSDGVGPHMPVIAAEGLAGRVTDVGQVASRVMLLTDASSRVPVKVSRTGWTGMIAGNGRARLDFLFDPQSGSDQLRVGDRLVTSGDGGLFPPGIPVAVVTDIGTTPIRARPTANPTGLGAVMVEAPWMPPPVLVAAEPAPPEPDRALPSAPPPTATPASPAALAGPQAPPARP